MLSATKVDCAQPLLKLQSSPSNLKSLLLKQFNLTGNAEIFSVKSIMVNGYRCRVGCLVVYDVVHAEDIPVFLLVKYILYIDRGWFVCGPLFHPTKYDTHLHAYCVENSNDWVATEASHTWDSQYLSLYEFGRCNIVIMQHRVIGKGEKLYKEAVSSDETLTVD
jgi:hypothetical protein